VRSIDRVATKANGPGPITRTLQKRFFGLFDGSTADRYGWLEPVRTVEKDRAVAAA
jgi:branched-chain amino acid aminotransferase